MGFLTPDHTIGTVNRAGAILAGRRADATAADVENAIGVLSNWRAAHLYPINTFQATLRTRLKGVDRKAVVAQRLKRTPSILSKLEREPAMQLARMQDIGGLRAVVSSIDKVRELETMYRSGRLSHELASSKDYINAPKADGYRSVHLVFRYRNPTAPAYEGLRIELQIRSKRQHEWATAVETASTFLRQSLKAGQGDGDWREFLTASSAAIAHGEGSPLPPGYEGSTIDDLKELVSASQERLNALAKLRGFSIAAEGIHRVKGQGKYHLVELNTRDRQVVITPFPASKLEEAEAAYAAAEARVKAGEPIDAVLISAGPIEQMKRAYPNYFLDAQGFISKIGKLISWVPTTENWTEVTPATPDQLF